MKGPSPDDAWDAFFSDFYLRAFAAAARDEAAEAQALAAARLVGVEPGQELLDVPCGFGRHSVPLARAGYKVTGVDRSETLIEEARRRAGGERWPKLVTGDVIEIAHRDAIVSGWSENGWHLLGEGRLLLEQRTFDPASGVAQTTQTLVDGASRESRTWSVRTYTATELLAMLERAGFAEARAYGGFDSSPLTTSSRLVLVAITPTE